MATLTIADLDNGKRDLETVDAVANSQADSTPTRYGQQTLTLAGALRRLGWQPPVPYAPGLTVTSGVTTVERDGVIYAPRVEQLPFTTGAWNPDQWRVVQSAESSNELLVFPTKGAADSAAATLSEGQVVEVEDVGIRYTVEAGMLTSPRPSDAIALQITNPSGNSVAGGFDNISKISAYSGDASRVYVWGVGYFRRGANRPYDGGVVQKDTQARLWQKEDASVVTPTLYGAVTGESDANASVNADAFERMRISAQAFGYRVNVERGTYVLPAGTRMDCNNTIWTHEAGAVYKLHGVQSVDTDFLIWLKPNNQKVFNLQIDANRAAQDPTLFGQDRCGGIVISAEDCDFEYVEVISSPGKGFVTVSEEGGLTRNCHFSKLRGRNCAQQVFLADGNNGLGKFKACTIKGVRVFETSHSGLAVNDGANDFEIDDVYCSVGSASVAEAVLFRDAQDCSISNVVGEGGTDGVAFSRLTLGVRNLTLSNIEGRGSANSGVIFLAAEDITGTNIRGVNNSVAGVNLAQLSSGLNKCKNIRITNVVGADNRGTPLQQYGIIYGGTQDCQISGVSVSRNTVKDILMLESVTERSWVDWDRTYTVEVPSIAAGSVQSLIVPIESPLPDFALAVKSAFVFVSTTQSALTVSHVASVSSTAVNVIIKNAGSSGFAGVLSITVGAKH